MTRVTMRSPRTQDTFALRSGARPFTRTNAPPCVSPFAGVYLLRPGSLDRVISGRVPEAAPKCSCEVIVIGEATGQRDLAQGLITTQYSPIMQKARGVIQAHGIHERRTGRASRGK